jgi:hypothetical protein
MIPYNPVWPDAATFIVERYKHSRPVAADPAYLFMFGRDLAPTGREDVSLYYVAAGQEGLIANKRRRLVAQVDGDAVYAIPNLAATS